MNDETLTVHLGQALMPAGWQRDVRLTSSAGEVKSIECGVRARIDDRRHSVGIPGMANVHSHAFQRAMSGLAEQGGPDGDNFWSWREAMYSFALAMSPDQMEAVAAQAYVEMLESGFTRVGEFHYLHHAPDGRAYDDVGEMAARIASAARSTGIALTLLPVFYAHSGFGGSPPSARQRRFVCDLALFERVVERSRAIVRGVDGASVGVAPHSLRAVTPNELAVICRIGSRGPMHIHIAEQAKEVDDCIAWEGLRPVEWLIENADVDQRWCVIHATHMTDAERARLARSGAVVGLCPITEANLGDGIFDAKDFIASGGRVGIGTDSNVQIGLADELRLLEYGQRLSRRARSVCASPGGSTGRALFDFAQAGGGAAMGRTPYGFAIGADADIVTLNSNLTSAIGRERDSMLDAWIFSGAKLVDCVYARGRLVVRDGAHDARQAVDERFRAAMHELIAA